MGNFSLRGRAKQPDRLNNESRVRPDGYEMKVRSRRCYPALNIEQRFTHANRLKHVLTIRVSILEIRVHDPLVVWPLSSA